MSMSGTACKVVHVLLVLVCVLPNSACMTAAPRTGGAVGLQPSGDLAVNREQLRLRVRALVGPVTGRIESSADDIARASADRTVQLAALDWKIQAVPAIREALFLPDPSLALIDALVLLYQMKDYFERGPGKAGLGGSSAAAAAACQSLADDLTQVAASATVSGDVTKTRDFIRQWAADHPITSTIAAREPVLSVAFRKDLADTLSVQGSVAEIAITFDDFTRRFEVYTSQLPKQARWELDRQRRELSAELLGGPVVPLAERSVTSAERIAAAVDRLVPALEAAARTAERSPEIVTAERRAALSVFATELTRTIEFVQRERLATLEFFTAERNATLDALQKTINAEQHALGDRMEQISVRVVNQAMDRLERLAFTILASVLVATFAGLVLIRLIFFRAGKVAI